MLHWETVNDLLKHSLSELMDNRLFDDFRLVGGTALSLHIGHRLSIDIACLPMPRMDLLILKRLNITCKQLFRMWKATSEETPYLENPI